MFIGRGWIGSEITRTQMRQFDRGYRCPKQQLEPLLSGAFPRRGTFYDQTSEGCVYSVPSEEGCSVWSSFRRKWPEVFWFVYLLLPNTYWVPAVWAVLHDSVWVMAPGMYVSTFELGVRAVSLVPGGNSVRAVSLVPGGNTQSAHVGRGEAPERNVNYLSKLSPSGDADWQLPSFLIFCFLLF